jgi:hypothetical protein
MDDNKIIKIAAYGFVGMIVAPIIVSVTFGTIGLVARGIDKIKYNNKIKKGLKDGSIVEIDGKYYKVKVDEA